MDKIGKRSEAEHDFKGGITTIASVPSNCLPIDQKCGKKPVKGMHFSELYGVLKYPVMDKKDIEMKSSSRIPPDEKGNRYAENIKLMKAQANTTDSEHPCSERNLMATFHQKANELAEYWRLKVPMRYESMTLEDAIWGTTVVQPMDLDTSTGAAFQMLFPGKTKKKHVLGERGEVIGEAGVWLKAALKEQWECWKRGDLWILPGSYSLKAECLPIEKVWKKRLVNVCDPVTTINSRRLMMPIQQAFTSLGAGSPYQLVMNPYVDMHGLAMQMLKYTSFYDVDVSGFDLTVPKIVLDADLLHGMR